MLLRHHSNEAATRARTDWHAVVKGSGQIGREVRNCGLIQVDEIDTKRLRHCFDLLAIGPEIAGINVPIMRERVRAEGQIEAYFIAVLARAPEHQV